MGQTVEPREFQTISGTHELAETLINNSLIWNGAAVVSQTQGTGTVASPISSRLENVLSHPSQLWPPSISQSAFLHNGAPANTHSQILVSELFKVTKTNCTQM